MAKLKLILALLWWVKAKDAEPGCMRIREELQVYKEDTNLGYL